MQKEKRNSCIKWAYLGAITLLAVYLRYWFITHIPTVQLYDFSSYHEIAANIYNHQGFTLKGQPVAWQGMGYSILLGWFFGIMGNARVDTAQILNLILSCLSLPLMYYVFQKLSRNAWVVLGAYTLAALLPNHIAYNNVVGTEVFFTFLFLVILSLQLAAFDKRVRYPLLGIFIGLAALTKPFFLAYPLVLALYMWMRSKDWRQAGILLLSASLLMMAVIAPWTLRNYREFNSFIPVSYNSGYVLYVNNNEQNVTGAWMPLDKIYAAPELKKHINRELDKSQENVKLAPKLDKILKPAATQWIADNPAAFVRLGLLRLKTTFFSGAQDISAWAMNDMQKIAPAEYSTNYVRNLNFFYALADFLVYMLCSAGILYLLLNLVSLLRGLFSRRFCLSDAILVPGLNTAFFLAVYFVFEGQPRYNYPLLFLFVICLCIIVEKCSTALLKE